MPCGRSQDGLTMNRLPPPSAAFAAITSDAEYQNNFQQRLAFKARGNKNNQGISFVAHKYRLSNEQSVDAPGHHSMDEKTYGIFRHEPRSMRARGQGHA